MANINLRKNTSSPLTLSQVDANFQNLNDAKMEKTDLAASGGAGMVGFIQSGTGAVARPVQDKAWETVSVKDFGAVGGGIADDTAAFLKAAAALGSKGGTIRYFDKHLIDVNLTLPVNVTVKGPMAVVGSPGINTSAPYGNMAALIVNSAATITLSSGAGFDGCLLYRKGMSFPAANSAAFAGTAVTAAGDDAFLINSEVLGFNKAFYSNNYQRPKVQNVNIDCVNGVEVNACYDISRIRDVHCWPFATIAQYAIDTTQKAVIQRSGTAFKFANVGDWNKITDCFSYGYFRGFVSSSADSMTFLSCSADSTGAGTFAGQIGFVIDGTSRDNRLVACQAAAQETGYYVNTTAGLHTRLIGCDSWACANQGVLVGGGDVSVNGGILRNTVHGITVTAAASKLATDGIRFEGLTGVPLNYTVANSKGIVGKNDYGDLAVVTPAINANATVPSVACADPFPTPVSGGVFYVAAGAASFGGINGGWEGRCITLIFSGAVTAFHGGVAPTGLKLSGAVNFVAAAFSTLSLVYQGGFWIETGRKT